MKGLYTQSLMLILLTVPLICQADLKEDLDEWFNSMNYNTTDPGLYKAQSANYLSFGGLSYRAPVTQPFNFIDIQTPKISAGCGGIDLYAGGFSAVNADAFVQSLRNIGQNAQSLAFMLAIRTVSPMLSGTMEKIEGWANEFNKFSMDSCAAATEVVGGTMDLFNRKQSGCTVRRMNDYGEDWNTAEQNCKSTLTLAATEAAGDSPNENSFVKGNLAWFILMQDSYFQSNIQLAELVMNLTGSVIITDSPLGNSRPRNIPSALSDGVVKERFKNIYTALLLGDESPDALQLYRCQGTTTATPMSCLTMTEQLQAVSPDWEGLHNTIDRLAASIVKKIREDGGSKPSVLDDNEKQLINQTALPLYKYLTVTTAYYPKTFNLSNITKNYTSLIAEDMLSKGLSAIIERMEQSAANLPKGLSSSKEVKAFRKNIADVLKGLAQVRSDNEVDLERYTQMLENIQLYEKGIMSKLNSGLLASALWGR